MVFHICRMGVRSAQLKFCTAKLKAVTCGWGLQSVKMAPMLLKPSSRALSGGSDNLISFFTGHKFMHKFDEQSKIIVVDGNIGCGKSTFSRQLADRLGLKHYPEAHLHYLDELALGEGKKYDKKYIGDVSVERFYEDPFAKDGHSFRFQMTMYAMRFRQYADAIQHLLETGQGLVLERSVYSDFVFMDAMFKMGYCRKACYDYYDEIKNISLYRLRPPHLVIYLDSPLSVLGDRIKSRGRDMENTIPDQYLQHIEDAYKNQFLPSISETTEVLLYDWIKYGELEQVIEDMSLLNFEHSAWKKDDDMTLDRLYRFVHNKFKVASCMDIPKHVPEITFGSHEFYDLTVEFEEKHNRHFASRYNPQDGESKFKNLFK